MPDLYRLADVVVSIPASDGGPVTVAEALAVGRPVVATDLPSVREWLAELDPEALVPVDDVAATAAAVETVLSRGPDERHERAARGRAAGGGEGRLADEHGPHGDDLSRADCGAAAARVDLAAG